ncbi:hypothetical protein ACVGVM_02745 [Pseudonocardia bannensis]|uniref:Uncharacterized protein n=1 Tax=Pseudonocardia bannensis TaxID=630973 RepID=A0A848DKP1_9PSEU|nr:hypothetical protein [Pseudonocardia bannensis]NMH93300.1 hypothetical protein [Pseudonocardia bannensis]
MVTGLHPPVVAGVAGGVGTTTVAVALRGHDAGRGVDTRTDVVVCRCTGDSLRCAAALADRFGPGPRPVLAVTADGAVPTRGPLHARLRMIEPQFAALVVLPRVGRWRELTDPLTEAAGLFAQPVEELPRSLRAYVMALRRLASAVAATGRLRQDDPRPRRSDAPIHQHEPPPVPARGRVRPGRGVRIVPPTERVDADVPRRSARLAEPRRPDGPSPIAALNGARP